MFSPRLPSRFAIWLLAAVLALGLAVTGCGGGQPSEQNGQTDEQGVQTIRLADQVGSEVDYAAVWVAENQGYFADEGIKIDRVTYNNGPEGLLHFSNGEVDALMGGLAPIMQSAAEGMDFVMLMSLTKQNAPLVGHKDLESYADLDGKTVGTPGLGTVQDAVLTYVEEQENIEFKRVYAKVTDFVPMAQRGEIQAFISWEPAAALAISEASEDLHYIEQVPPIENAESLEMIVQRDFAEENPELTTKFVRAILRGIAYIEQNSKEEIASIIAGKMKNPDAADEMLTAMDSVILTDPRVDMPSTKIILKTAAEAGKIPEDLVEDVEGWMGEYIDYSYLEEAEASLE